MNVWDCTVELWQRGNGKWTWVLYNRPNVHRPPTMTINAEEFDDPHACARDAERAINRGPGLLWATS